MNDLSYCSAQNDQKLSGSFILRLKTSTVNYLLLNNNNNNDCMKSYLKIASVRSTDCNQVTIEINNTNKIYVLELVK
ncbi:6757_t:CDS:1, partial [Entrophospora sp. SA101]